jgi:hypothetical protein
MKKFFPIILLVFLFFLALFPLQKTQAEDGPDTMNSDISLSYLPKNPVNDPSGKNPTEITVSASVFTNTDKDALNYTWTVYGSTEDSDPTDWTEILKKDLVDVSKMSGFGTKELKFKLAVKDRDLKFIRVKAKVKEVTSMGDTNDGNNDIVIPINSISGELSVFSVSATDNNLGLKDRLCENATKDFPCVVTKNELVGLKLEASKLTNFTWTLDGEPLTYTLCPLDDCDSSNEAFFPVLKDNQDTYEIAVSANDKTTGRRVTFNQSFVVTEPTAFITSADKTTCAPVLDGYFRDLDDNLTPDYSHTNFQAIAGSTIKLNPNFNAQDIKNVFWTVDITQLTQETANQYGLVISGKDYGVVINDDGSISFPADTQVGYSFDVNFSTLYTPDKSTKKALNKYWGIGLNDFYEKQIDATINITVVDALESVAATSSLPENKKKNTLAALASSAPAQLIFLVKIVLISFLLLFSSYFLLSLFPKKNHD